MDKKGKKCQITEISEINLDSIPGKKYRVNQNVL